MRFRESSGRRFLSSAAFAGLGIYTGSFAALLPTFKESLHASDPALGAALLLGSVGALPGGLLLGPLLARTGRMAQAIACAAAAVLVLSLTAASTLAALTVALIVIGMAWSVVDVITNGVLVAHERVDGRPLLQQGHAFYPVAAVGGSLGTGIARNAGVGVASILLAVTAVNLLIAIANIGALSPRVDPSPHGGRRLPIPREVLIIGGIGFLAFLVESALFAWSAIALTQIFGAAVLVAALAPMLFSLTMFAGRLAAHHAAGAGTPAAIVRRGLAPTIAGIALLVAAPSALVAILGFGLAGYGLAAWAPAMFGMAGMTAHRIGRNSTMGEVATISYLGLIVGPGLVGAVSGLAGLRVGLGLLSVAVVLLAVLLKRTAVGGVHADADETW